MIFSLQYVANGKQPLISLAILAPSRFELDWYSSRLVVRLGRMLPLFRFGLGGKIGSGKQWWSWISSPR
jgi:hypothetical protein